MNIKYCFLALLLAISSPCHAADNYSTGDYLADILVYRPGGSVLTLLGVSAFIVTSPAALLVTLLPPHNTIQDTADNMVIQPFNNTFSRPLGSTYPYW